MVKPTRSHKMVPMLKPRGPKIDANGKTVKPISAKNGKIDKNDKR